ncbi:MAG: PAS domain S-box protein [Burkholderiales bacterium]|nr:PAS domain S-box protein [Burkholderiales bacterium]
MLGPTLVVACLVAALAVISVKVLGSVRGYATGESAWSKSCGNALLHLSHYALSRDQADFTRFEQSLQAPLGSRRAREELLTAHPNKALIRQLFIAGGSHVDDVPGMIILFRYFGALPLFERTIAAWVEGDHLIDRLRALGQQVHQQVNAGADDAAIQSSLQQIRLLTDDFSQAEQRFRVNLDDAGRFTEWLLIGAILLAAAILSWISVSLVRRSLRKQVRHERALAAITRRWELAAEVAGLGLFEQNGETDNVALDAKAAHLYGVSETACQTPCSQLDKLICENDRRKTRAALERALQTGQTVRDVHSIKRADGHTRQVELIGRQDIDERKGQVRLVGVVRDVTDEMVQAQLTMQRDAAEQVAQAQRDFLSRLSHELRTPLNAILGFAQLLNLDKTTPLPTHQHQQVAMILAAGQQLLALIEDVLDLSKVEAGEINMQLQPVDLNQTLRASMAMIDSARQLLGVHFVDQLPPTALWVQADPQRLQQVCLNLLSNSCKYNRPGGRVVISASLQEPHVLVHIRDDGQGLTLEETSQLFQPFKRVASTAAQAEGTGLGLYIVKQLLERMHGQVTVQSEKGKGSTFSITLPSARAPQAAPVALI